MIQLEALPGIRMSGPLASVTVAATTTALYTISTGKRAIIKKILAFNRQGGNVELTIGYDTLAAVWTPTMPALLLLAGMDNVFGEADIPIGGNSPEGYVADTTLLTGFAGVIACQASAAGVAPNDIEVRIEVEEY